MGELFKWLAIGYAALFVAELMWVGYHWTKYIQELRELVGRGDEEL